MPLGDNLGDALDDLDGGLVVDGVCGIADVRCPPLSVGQVVFRHPFVVQVRIDGEVHDPQRAVVPGRRLLVHEVLSDSRCHHHAAGADTHPDFFGQRWQESGESGLSHLMT